MNHKKTTANKWTLSLNFNKLHSISSKIDTLSPAAKGKINTKMIYIGMSKINNPSKLSHNKNLSQTTQSSL